MTKIAGSESGFGSTPKCHGSATLAPGNLSVPVSQGMLPIPNTVHSLLTGTLKNFAQQMFFLRPQTLRDYGYICERNAVILLMSLFAIVLWKWEKADVCKKLESK
jgi:hypothetical protein